MTFPNGGSRNKYTFDLDLGTFRLKAVLPQGNVFPFDFGFIPSTKADDGDPLDLLVLLEDSVPMGCALSVRLIGAIEAAQKEKGEVWVRNDRAASDKGRRSFALAVLDFVHAVE